jgi:hypothetical protein
MSVKTQDESKASTASNTNQPKDFKIKRKKSSVKRKSVTRTKRPYNEGAEETKNWLDSQSDFNPDNSSNVQ